MSTIVDVRRLRVKVAVADGVVALPYFLSGHSDFPCRLKREEK